MGNDRNIWKTRRIFQEGRPSLSSLLLSSSSPPHSLFIKFHLLPRLLAIPNPSFNTSQPYLLESFLLGLKTVWIFMTLLILGV